MALETIGHTPLNEEKRLNPKLRPYTRADFGRVSAFLIAHFQPDNRDGNWLQPEWDYMHSHPMLDETSLGRIGIWECAEGIVGVVNYESVVGEAFFQLHPMHTDLRPAMLDYAEIHLRGVSPSGETYLRAYANDFDHEFEALLQARAYRLVEDCARPLSRMKIPAAIPHPELPTGFRVKSLVDENDLSKINRVLWRGFNHPGEPPEEGLEGRRKMQSGPNFRKDLTIVVEEPSGQFVSYCGMWYEATHHFAYVEPMATDPDFRQQGLGKAALWEGIRRCASLGAEVVFVGSDQEFYKAVGFRQVSCGNCWEARGLQDAFRTHWGAD